MKISKGLYKFGEGIRANYFFIDLDKDNELRVYTDNSDNYINMPAFAFLAENSLSNDQLMAEYSNLVEKTIDKSIPFKEASKRIKLIKRALNLEEKINNSQSLPKCTDIQMMPEVPGTDEEYRVPDGPGPILENFPEEDHGPFGPHPYKKDGGFTHPWKKY